jgi:SNF2 family DNA or RNA helicase
MKYTPHDYQKYATDFILQHPISAVILFLGAGKTVITLTAIESLMYDSFEINKVLIVAPLRVAKVTWKDEITKWDHLQDLSYVVAVGTEEERLAALRQNADITIINRENLQWLIEKSKIPFDYDCVVLDELSSFKSWQSKRFRAFMKVRPKVSRVIGLTGTPAPNSLMDLFAEFKCLDMGERLGRFITQYRAAYFTPDKMNGQVVYSYKLLPGAADQIYNKISDITISMKAMDHLKMPELISNRYPVYMDDDETRRYEAMKRDLVLPYKNEDDITAANAAALSGKLCQMANGAVYSDNGDIVHIHDRKLDALEDLIEAAQGPILLCYWYKHDLSRIENRLDHLKVTYSRISTEESIRCWNEGKYQVGLIHPASAGHGLNLQKGGNVIVWFGLTWSLELYEQTNARLWRQGQEASTVVVQHIVTAGTIDERILKAISRKESGQNALIEAVKAEL